MQRLFIKQLLCLFLAGGNVLCVAQNAPPELISYQGIARDASGNPLPNQPIGIKFVLHQGNPTGTVVFTDTLSVSTNSLGLFTAEIGKNNTSSFQSVNWANGPYYLEVQMDPAGGTSYQSVGTQQLLSVPYALYSKRAKTVDSIPDTGTSAAWSTKGNYQTDSTINFLGTKDYFPLIFRTANTERMRIGKNGRVRIGNSIVSSPALLSVFGTNTDTVLAHFSNTNLWGSLLDVYNLNGWAGTVFRSGVINQDTAFIGIKKGDGLLLASTSKMRIFAHDSINLFSQNKSINIGSTKNISVYALTDSIKLYGRSLVYYSIPFTATASTNDAALTVNFSNNNNMGSSGLRINHNANDMAAGNLSYGIYVDNSSTGTISGSYAIGVGSYFSSSYGLDVNRRGFETSVSGAGTNMGLYIHADTGTTIFDGYTNWSVYSDKGNIMIKDGHIKSDASTSPSVTPLSSPPLTVSLLAGSTDVKGTVQVSGIASFGTYSFGIDFAQAYSTTPVVVVSVIDNGSGEAQYISYYISSVSSYGFVIEINNNASLNINNLKFTYIVIE